MGLSKTAKNSLLDKAPKSSVTHRSIAKKYLSKANKTAFPENIKPMLATLVKEPFDDENWLFEIKWDGYRALALLRNGVVNLNSRNNLSFNKKFHPVAAALKAWDINAILDGEIVALNDDGMADFQLLQAWQKTGEGKLIYYIFDILWLDGYSTLDIPLIERKALLKSVIRQNKIIRYSDHILERGEDFFVLALKKGIEGIMAKKTASTYHPDTRTKEWLKIKTQHRQETVIAGFTEGRGSRSHFGALVLGVYKNKELIYVGHTGSGFDERTLKEVYRKLKPLVTRECPFEQEPKTKMPVTWVKPVLVCEIRFQEWTRDHSLRHPIFMGLREDKKATEVRRETEINTSKVVKAKAKKPEK